MRAENRASAAEQACAKAEREATTAATKVARHEQQLNELYDLCTSQQGARHCMVVWGGRGRARAVRPRVAAGPQCRPQPGNPPLAANGSVGVILSWLTPPAVP